MAEPLVIGNIALESRDERQPKAAMRRGGRWFDVVVRVTNAEDKPLYVVSQIRRIEYEEASRQLNIHCGEDAIRPGPSGRPPLLPTVLEVAGGSTEILRFPISSPMTFLEADDDGRPRTRQVRIPDDVETIQCILMYGVEQPPRSLNLFAPGQAIEGWTGWGSKVTAKLGTARRRKAAT